VFSLVKSDGNLQKNKKNPKNVEFLGIFSPFFEGVSLQVTN